MNTPNIRFKGFTEDWEKRKLGDIAEIKDSARIPNDEWTESGVPYIRASDISHDDLSGVLFISKDKYEFYKERTGAPNKNDVLFNGGGEIGKAILKEDDSPVYVQGGAVLYVRTSEAEHLRGDYLVSYFSTKQAERYIEVASAGGTMKHYTLKPAQNMPVVFPGAGEQAKIGAYFSEFDNLITFHQRKCDDLKEVKKYMLQKMFPKQGEKVPEIRFAGFTGDWEQRKFGDIGSVSMCKRIFKDETTNEGDVPFFKIGTFGSEPDAYISRKLYEEYKSKYPYPKNGDILLSASGTIGRMVEYNGEEAYFQDSNIVWLNHDLSVDNKFLKVLYKIVKWDGIEGSTIQRLYNDNFLKTKFMMPSVGEQKRIGAYFANLDNLITLHQRKSDSLKEIKKFMLQNMFPNK